MRSSRRNSLKTISIKDEAINICHTNQLNEPLDKAKVVIIGAGLAGLAAAQKLYQAGLRDIIVLEAQNRVGGRVLTVDHGDYLLELGAQWLHGASENPLYNWCNEMNMLNDFEYASLGMEGLFCDNFGRKIGKEIVNKFLDVMTEIKLSLSKNNYSEIIKANNFKNAAQVFKHQLEAKLNQFEEDEQSKQIIKSLFDWFLRYESIENCCDTMEHVSISSYTNYADFCDGDLINFKEGYRSLLSWFCKQMPTQDIIYLNKQVTKIELQANKDNSSYIRVRYSSRSDNQSQTKNENQIECEHVILTSSLGFLKKHAESLFEPPLPKVKIDLIDSIGFGTVNKIILQFETRFWDSDHGIKLVWNEDKCSSNERSKLPEWTRDIIAFDSARKQPNVLIGWIGGRGAKAMELESDKKIAETCLLLLDRFLPKEYNKPSRLVACVCSRWYSNPFTLGSYSFQSMESFNKNVNKLQEPIYDEICCKQLINSGNPYKIPRILFAGEATAGELYSTAHGAVISGWREADRLVDCIRAGEKHNNSNQKAVLGQSIVNVLTSYDTNANLQSPVE